jgi:Domain of unknown function (DUF4160)
MLTEQYHYSSRMDDWLPVRRPAATRNGGSLNPEQVAEQSKLCNFVIKRAMPEIFRFFGIRFFYFSNDHLPVHVYIKTNEGTAKFEVEPLTLIENKGVKMKDIYLAESIIEENKELIIRHWIDFFNNIKK